MGTLCQMDYYFLHFNILMCALMFSNMFYIFSIFLNDW